MEACQSYVGIYVKQVSWDESINFFMNIHTSEYLLHHPSQFAMSSYSALYRSTPGPFTPKQPIEIPIQKIALYLSFTLYNPFCYENTTLCLLFVAE